MDLILEISSDRKTEDQKYDEDIAEPTTRFEYDHLIVFRPILTVLVTSAVTR